jgi:hypothetical protein
MSSPESDEVSKRIKEIGSKMEREGKAQIGSGYRVRVDHF